MSLMTNNGKILTSEDKPILIKGVTLKEVEQMLKNNTITYTNGVIPAQNVSLQTLHDTYGDCFVGRVTYTGFNVLFLFSYNKEEDYYNLTIYYGTQLKAYTHVDMNQTVITLIKHTTPTYSNTYTDDKINELINNKVYDLNQRIDDTYMELESMIEESRNEIEDRENLVSIIGNATETLAGVMSAEDKKNLNTLLSLLQDNENNITDTIAEVFAIFEQYPEGANLVATLATKADKADTYTKEDINNFVSNLEPKKKHITVETGLGLPHSISNIFKKIQSGEFTVEDTGSILNNYYTIRIQRIYGSTYLINLTTLNYYNSITAEFDISNEVPEWFTNYTQKPLYEELYVPTLQITGIGGHDIEVAQQLMYYIFEHDITTLYLINNQYYGKMTKNTGPGVVINIHRIYDGTQYNTVFDPSTINSYVDIPVTINSYYDKDTVDNLLLYKADKDDTYSKSEVNSLVANAGGMSKDTYKNQYQEILWLGSDMLPELPTIMPEHSSNLTDYLTNLKTIWTDININLINTYGYDRVVFLAKYNGTLVKVEISYTNGAYRQKVHSSIYKANVKECISLNTDKRYKLVNDTYTTTQETSYFLEELKIDNPMSLETNHNHIIMNPNVYYIVDSQVAPHLTFTLLDYDPKETYVYREYMGEIRVDENPTTAIIDERIRWNTAEGVTIEDHVITLEAKRTYLFSILNYIGLISSISNPQLDAPVLTLNGSVLSWESINNAKTYRIYTTGNDLVEVSNTQIDLKNYITDPGIYIVYVEAKDNYYTDNVNSIEYVVSTTLSTPVNLVVNEANTLSWDSVENASSYLVTLKETSSTKTVTTNLCDLTTFTELSTAGTYTFVVSAVGDGKVYLTSNASAVITVTIPEA